MLKYTKGNKMKAIVWSKYNCPFCDQAKALLKQRGIPFEEKKIGDGTCTPKKIPKIAKLADHDGVIHTSWGDLNYTKGNDYIVRHGPGDYGAVKKDIFNQTYDTSNLNRN